MHVIVICIVSGNYVLGRVWAVHIELKKADWIAEGLCNHELKMMNPYFVIGLNVTIDNISYKFFYN